MLEVAYMSVKEETIGYAPSLGVSITYPAKSIGANKKIGYYTAFWVFVFGSVMGFVVETLWCFIRNGNYQCRSSMLFGPFNVIYGIAALVLYVGLHKAKNDKVHLVFIYGMVAGTAIEFIASWVQQSAFGSVSWDYSTLPLNLGGRVSLLYTIFWGLLAVLWIKTLQPMLEKLIFAIPKRIDKPLAVCLHVFLVLDIAISIIAVARWGMRLDGVPAANAVTAWLDNRFPDAFMERVYNNMLFVK